MNQVIQIRDINGDAQGKTWESESLLRVGSLATLDIVLDDSSVSRHHAEVRATPLGWRVRDMGSTNGTFLAMSDLANRGNAAPEKNHLELAAPLLG